MTKINKIDYEIKCTYQEIVISRTDISGNIIYCNSTFTKINGFQGSSAINQPYGITNHPDMPQTIFDIIWKTINKGLPIQAIVKNITKDSKYYWSIVEWKPQRDNQNRVVSYVSHGKQAPEQVVKIIEPLYQMLYDIEKKHGMESALKFLHSYLDEENMTYSQYLYHLTKNRGFKCLCEFIRHNIVK